MPHKHEGPIGPHEHDGSIGAPAAAKEQSRPTHQWNRMVVSCLGSHLKVELNGEQIIDTQLDQGTMKDRPPEGYIGFQGHGQSNNIKFRDIRIHELKQTD